MELRAMPWHESIIESELAKTKVLVNATSIGLTTDETPVPAEILTGDLLVLDLIYAKTRLLRDAAAAGATVVRRRADAAPPGRSRVHAVDRPAGAARGHGPAAGRGAGGGLRSAEGEPTGAGGPAPVGEARPPRAGRPPPTE